jgi:uncharacterized membrane protein YoaK (UPF0700 family)
MTNSLPFEPLGLVLPSSARVADVPSVDDSIELKLLPFVLSMIAGSLDVIGFLGLGGIFTAHITGNLVILVARLVAKEPAPMSHIIAIPVFMAILALTRLFVARLDRVGVASLLPLLTLQFLLLLMTFGVCLAVGWHADPHGLALIWASMLAVSAMAVQNALVRVSLTGAPSTAVMTTNITVVIMDLGEIWFGRSVTGNAKAHDRVRSTWPAIVGFLLGCAIGALCEPGFGLAALAAPILLSLIAIGLALIGRMPC